MNSGSLGDISIKMPCGPRCYFALLASATLASGCVVNGGVSHRGNIGAVVGGGVLAPRESVKHQAIYVGGEIGIRKEDALRSEGNVSGWMSSRIASGWTSIEDDAEEGDWGAVSILASVGIDYSIGGLRRDLTLPIGVMAPIYIGEQDGSRWITPSYNFHVGDELGRRHEFMVTVGSGFVPDLCLGPPTVCGDD